MAILARDAIEEKDCAWCDQPFRPRRPEARYCSRSCTTEQFASWAKRPRNARPYEEKPCARCAKMFGPLRTGDGRHWRWKLFDSVRYCSKSCSAIATFQKGPYPRNARKQLKDACERCGLVPEHKIMLEIHHLDGSGYMGNQHPDNLVTLCANCHRYVTHVDKDWQPRRTWRYG